MTSKDDFNAKKLLKRLKEARDADPNWEKAIADLAAAEAKYAKHDPVEGKPFVSKPHTAPKRSK